MTRVRFHDAAMSELAHEVAYYAKISPALGERFAAAVERAVKIAVEFPEMGSPHKFATRRVFPQRFPFLWSTFIAPARYSCSRSRPMIASQAIGKAEESRGEGGSSYLAALVPRTRLHLIGFHGVLAPNATLRALVVPHGPEEIAGKSELPATEPDCAHGPNCVGQLKIIAAILEAPVIQRILTHLGLQARAPPRAPARGDLAQAA